MRTDWGKSRNSISFINSVIIIESFCQYIYVTANLAGFTIVSVLLSFSHKEQKILLQIC